MGFADIDSHLIETDETWDFLDPADRAYRPRVVEFTEPVRILNFASADQDAEAEVLPPRQMWLVGDTLPAVLQQHARLAASGSSEFLRLQPITPDQIEARNIFIACEVDEDIPYLAGWVGENVLCIGTDYGHNDVGSELAAHAAIMSRRDIPAGLARRITDTNGRRMLGLPAAPDAGPVRKEVPGALPNVRGARAAGPVLTSAR